VRLLAAFALAAFCGAAAAQPLKVGTKRFTESYILGEILARAAPGQLKPGLGNTGIVFAALKSGAIDVYPEYTGTIAREILRLEGEPGLVALNRALAPHGLAAGVPLGFSNSYALAMREDRAEKLAIRSLSDLARHPRLKLGLSQEFLAREDGWPGLKAAYRLPFSPAGLDHGLAYEALAAGDIDVMDIYTTDAKILGYRLRPLADDRRYFPPYEAVTVVRTASLAAHPGLAGALANLTGRLDAATMRRLNHAVDGEHRDPREVGRAFLRGVPGAAP